MCNQNHNSSVCLDCSVQKFTCAINTEYCYILKMWTAAWPNSTVWAGDKACLSAHTVDIIQPDWSHTSSKPAEKYDVASQQWYKYLKHGLLLMPMVWITTLLGLVSKFWQQEIGPVTNISTCSSRIPHPTLTLVPKLVGRSAPGNPSWRQATSEFIESQKSSHTVPHCPKTKTSSLPDVKELLVVNPCDSLRSPLTVN